MSKNPEDRVLDEIDQLVNEQLAVGPVDDYTVDRYPDCNLCPHKWHGEKCHWCHCQQSTGEVVVQQRAPSYVQRQDVFSSAPWVRYREGECQHCGRPANDGHGHGGPRRENLRVNIEGVDFDFDVAVGEPPSPRRDLDFHVHWLDENGHCRGRGDCPGGYTAADIEELRARAWRPNRSWVLPDYPQRYILGHEPRPRVRFWEYNHERDLYVLIQGDAEVMRIDWNRDGCTMAVRLEPYSEQCILAEELSDPAPTDPVPDGMIAFEGANPEDGGFHLVGHLHPDDIRFDHSIEQERAFRGEVVGPLQEHHEVTVRIDNTPGELLQ